jgi:hypothetical protein
MRSSAKRRPYDPTATRYSEVVNWNAVDPSRLFDTIRERGPAEDAERTVWAFERALEFARLDPELMGHLLVACVCLVAHAEGETPRTVLEQRFRRAVSDDEWREHFVTLLA